MAITRLNSLAIPAGTVEPADISYPLTNFSSTGIDDNATSTQIEINSSNNIQLCGASGTEKVNLDGGLKITRSSYPVLVLQENGATGIGQVAMNGNELQIRNTQDYDMSFFTNNSENMRIENTGKITYGGTGRKSYLIGNDTGDNVVLAAGDTRYIRVARIGTGYHTLRMAPWGNSAYHGAEINVCLNWNNTVSGSDHLGFSVVDLKRDGGFTEFKDIYAERINNTDAYIWVKITNGSSGTQTYNFDIQGLEYSETTVLALSNTTTDPGLTSRAPAHTVVATNDNTSGGIHIYRGNSDYYVSSGASIIDFTAGGTAVGSITASGTSGVNYNTTSDISLKENIQDAESASEIIDALKIRQFDWKDSQDHQSFGVVAQEVEPTFTDAVTQDKIWSVDYSKFVPLLIKEIQDLRARVAELENN